MNIFTEQPLLPTSPLLLQQVLDGLLMMVHHLPDHVRADLHTSLQIFCSTLQTQADHSSHGPTHQCSSPASSTTRPRSCLIFRLYFPGDGPPLQRPSDNRWLCAATSCRHCDSYGSQTVPLGSQASECPYLTQCRSSSRRSPQLRSDRHPALSSTTITLEDIQKTMANLQSQVDRHTPYQPYSQ